MYVKISNGAIEEYPYSISEMRRDHPNTSFPKILTDETLASVGVYRVTFKYGTPFDLKTQKLGHASQPTLIDGVWTVVESVVALTSDEVTAVSNRAAQDNRDLRDERLAQTDWWASSDLTMTAEQAAYRQSLRDITSHANWPHLEDADWPTKPS